MTAIRRFRTPLVLLIVVLLSSPALAACCVSAAEPMACCEQTEDARLATPCCMSSSQAPPQQPPASVVKLSKLEPGAPAPCALQPSIAPAIVQAPSFVDRFNRPPGSDPLYLRLSAIRR